MVTSYELQVTSYRLRVTGYGLRVTVKANTPARRRLASDPRNADPDC
jgi:hypothetical protein